jgi:hypothetical protein
MEEHHQQDNGGHGSAQVYESTVQSDARGGDGKGPRQDLDPGRVGRLDAKAEERGENVEALGRRIQALSAGGDVYARQRQVANFYGMRLRRNVEFGRRFAEVNGIADLFGLQRKYVSDMLLDYASNFCSLYGFGLRGVQQTAERLNR